MRTSVKSLITTVCAAIALTSTYPNNLMAAEKTSITFKKIENFRKIVINGNVEVLLVQQPRVGISYTDDNKGCVKVVQQGEVLRITNSDIEKCKIVIYVNDIYRIEASDNTVLRTEAKLNTKFLQIILKGNALADVDTNSEGIYTEILDNSTLKLKGTTNHHALVMGEATSLTLNGFASAQTDVRRIETTEEKIAAIAP